jgi:hypothetical protein
MLVRRPDTAAAQFAPSRPLIPAPRYPNPIQGWGPRL